MRRWLTRGLAMGLPQILRVVRAMLGTGDYDAYLRHMGQHHPGRPAMSRAAFFRDRQEARYGGRSGGRCC